MSLEELAIGGDNKVFIIVEAGVNHKLEPEDLKKIGAKDDIEVAFKLVDAAVEAGADAIKFQTFTAESLQFKGTKKPQYQVDNVGSDDEISYFDMLKKLEPTHDEQRRIADYCAEKGILFFSTPYDNESTDFLDEEMEVPLFKLASIDLNNHLFVRYVASKGKPLIISTGLCEMDDVRHVYDMAVKEGFADRLVLLQCTSNYPTLPEDIHLNVLKTYAKEFPEVVYGLSDHSPTDTASIGAIAIGGKVLEKHFSLSHDFDGPDHSSSLNPEQLKAWISHVREIETSMGSYDKKVTDVEKRNESMRKYLVMTPQAAGTVITEDMLRTMRTGSGIRPVDENLGKIVGYKLKDAVEELTPFTWGDDRVKERIVIIGAGAHARVIADMISLTKDQKVVGFTDSDTSKKEVDGFPVLGNDDVLDDMKDKFDSVVIGLGMELMKIREKIYQNLKSKGIKLAKAIHPSSVIAKNVEIGAGTVIMGGTVINVGSVIQDNCVINTSATLDHDNKIAHGAFINPGATLAGAVEVGEHSMISMSASVLEKRKVGNNSIVGAGAVVTKDVPDNVVVTGVPAKKMRDN